MVVGSTEGPIVVFPFPDKVATAASLDSDNEDVGTDIDESKNQESLQTLDRILKKTGQARKRKGDSEENEEED